MDIPHDASESSSMAQLGDESSTWDPVSSFSSVFTDPPVSSTTFPDVNNTVTWDEATKELERLVPWTQYILIVAYSVCAFMSISGNVTVIIVLKFGRRSPDDLRKFYISLAISDILMGIFSIPFTYMEVMLARWPFPDIMCPIVRFAQLCAVCMSAYTLVAIGADRCLVIVWPLLDFRYRQIFAWSSLGLIWIISGLYGVTQAYLNSVKYFEHKNHMIGRCVERFPAHLEHLKSGYNYLILVGTFIIPAIALVCLYGFMGLRIWRHTTPGNPDNQRDQQFEQRKLKMVKTLIIVVSSFLICWMPQQFLSMAIQEWPSITTWRSSFHYNVFFFAFYFCHWLAMSNSFMNPFIYGFFNEYFMADLRDLARNLACLRALNQRTTNHSIQSHTIKRASTMRSTVNNKTMTATPTHRLYQQNSLETQQQHIVNCEVYEMSPKSNKFACQSPATEISRSTSPNPITSTTTTCLVSMDSSPKVNAPCATNVNHIWPGSAAQMSTAV